jgi:large repetitive protein
MGLKKIKLLALPVIFFCLSGTLKGQNFTFNCAKDTTIAGCSASPCFTLRTIIPDIHGVSDSYTINPVTNGTSSCLPVYSEPSIIGTPTNLTTDDLYSSVIPIGFPFPFYGTYYNNLVVSTNGVVSFNTALANGDAEWQIINGGTPVDLPSTFYDQALIMGPYHDINIGLNSSSERRIQYTTVGAAPNRKWIVSFYKIPLFSQPASTCQNLIENTHQIVLYESTGIIEVLIFSKQICTSWNQGRAMVGIQNFARNQGMMAPGRKASDPPWGSVNMNESWRFVPSGGPSLFKRVELYDLSNTLLATGTANSIGDGKLEALFPNICPPPGVTTTYVIKSVYSKIDDDAVEIFGSDTVRVTRTTPTDLNATATTTQSACGQNTGTITVSVPNGIGTAPFQYSVDGGALQSSSTFTGLAATSHAVHVQDANGCFDDITVAVTASGVLNVTYQKQDASCSGGNNGSITINPPVGTAPITYSINGGPFTTNNIFSNLAPGTYTVDVHDAAGCQKNGISITIAQGPYLTFSSSASATSCPGANNGSITISSVNGMAPFQYSVNAGPYQSGATFSNLQGNTNYYIRVKDAINCVSDFIAVNVPEGPGTLTGTAAATATSCSGATDGSITVTPTTGTGPYEYSINSGGNWQTGNVFSGLAANSYTVIIREGGLCTSGPIAVTVSAGPVLTGTVSSTPTACVGVNNGTITVTATNGSGPYQYALDGGTFQSSNTFTGVAAGPHNVVIKNASGCVSGNISAPVATGSALTANVSATTTSCSGAADGTITVTPTNGTGPYQYALDAGAFQSSATFTGVTAGAHTVKVKDNFGCTSAGISAPVTAGAVLTGTAISTSTACTGVNNGTVTATPGTGFTGPFEYSLDGGTYQSSNTFAGIAAGDHIVKIRNASGCVSNNITVNVAAGTELAATVASAATSCSGATDGTITVTPTNGSSPYQYALDGGAYQSSNTFTGVATGPHNITVKDNFGCISAAISAPVTAGPVLTGTATSTPTACAGVNNGTITASPGSGFTGPFEYSLDGGSFQSSGTFTGLTATSHTVKIRNASGCISNDIAVTIAAGAELTATVSSTNTLCSGAADGTITVTPTNGSGPYQYALDAGAFQNSATFTGVTAGAHTIKVKDNFGCISSPVSAPITAGPVLTGTATSTATACAGVNNGTITVTPGTGFTGPFEYSLDGGTFQSSGTFTGLTATGHTVKIRNASACISNDIAVTVAAGAELTATISSANTSCSGAADGTITVTPTNGSGPYQYALDAGAFQNSATFTGVPAGAHTVKVKDNFGCISSPISAPVTAGPVLTGTATSTATACAGVNNGTITVTPGTGFTGPFEYSLDGGTFQSSNTFTGLAATGHTVKIRNASGCISNDIAVTVAAGAELTATVSSTNTSCSGATDGTITVTPTNGSGPYQYALDAGAFQNSATFTGVIAGPHTVKVKDNFGCISSPIAVPVTAGPVLTGTASSTATACAGVNNGTITVTPGAAFTGPFQYALDAGAFQPSNIFTGVTAADHVVKIRNTAGCISNDIAVTVAAGAELTATATTVSTSCSGAADGKITVTPTNGSSPYQYSLDGGSYQTSNTFMGMTAGAHSVTVKDKFGCISPAVATPVAAGPVLTGTATSTSTACPGVNNGTITATPGTGFTGPFQYSLDGGPFQPSNTFSGVTAADHIVTIRNTAGCVSTDIPITVAAGAALTGGAAATEATCNGVSDGTITITPANGSAPYQYALNGGPYQSSNVFSGLAANSYSVTIKDAFGCVSAAIPVTVNQPAVMVVAAPAIQNVSCNGGNDGVITVTATGGTIPYSYSLNTSPFQPGNTFTVPQGVYAVHVKDTRGCIADYPGTVTVTQPAVLTASVVATTNSTCNGGNDGVIELAAAGGTAPYQYSVDGINFQASNQLNVTAGIYPDVTIKDANGCILAMPDIEVEMTDNLTLSVTNPAPICEGSSVQLDAVSNATGYTWTSVPANANLTGATTPTPVAAPASTTTYTVTATLGNCTKTAPILVTVLPAPVANAGVDGEICYGQDFRLQGSGGVTYNWTPSTYLDDHTLPNPQVIMPLKSITYVLNVVDANNCPSLATDKVTVNVVPPIKVTMLPADTVVYAGVQFQLLAVSAGTNYVWSPATGLNNPNIPNPVVTAPLIEGAVVNYTVLTTTAAGCQGEGKATVRVYKGPDIYVVNAFTPNNDGKNDVFTPFPVGIKQLTYFRIFNRWGKLLFSTTTLNKGWDGKLGGLEQEPGVYVWMVQAVTETGVVITRNGTVTLIR